VVIIIIKNYLNSHLFSSSSSFSKIKKKRKKNKFTTLKMNLYIFYFILTITPKFIHGENTTTSNGECEPINTLLGKNKSNNCCLETGITCDNDNDGHVTEM